MTKNSSRKYFWTKYISLLLAAFVFVMGMLADRTTFAANDKQLLDLDPVIKSVDKGLKSAALFDFFGGSENYFNEYKIGTCYKIEGADNLKVVKFQTKDFHITGSVVQGEKIRIHNIMKTLPLDTVNSQRAAKNLHQISNLSSAASIKVVASKDGKVLKQADKSFKNTVDCYIDFEIPLEATKVEIHMHRRFAGQMKVPTGKGYDYRPTIPIDDEVPFVLAAVPANVANEAAEEGGIGIIEIGGGLFLLFVGGLAFVYFTGGIAGGAPMPELPEPPEPEPEPPAPPEPDYFLYKDPAGFETLYIKDPETGQWYNYQDYEEGYRAPVDMDKLQEYDAQRREDVKWNRDQMEKLENRETQLDKELKQEYQDMLAREKQIREETKQDLIGLRTNTYGLSKEERRSVMEERQAKDQKDVDKWTKRADAWDTAMTVAEGVQTAADIGVDILATVTAPAGGGLIADAYAITKNVAGCGMEGLVNKERTLAGGLLEGITKGGIDYAQNHSGAKWQKLLSYVGGESVKGGIDAGLKGESVVKGAVKGALQGGTKLGVDAVGKKIGDKITKNSSDSLKHAYEHAGDIRKRIAPQVSERSAKALQEMNLQKHLANIRKGEHQTLANTITQGITRNLLPKVFG